MRENVREYLYCHILALDKAAKRVVPVLGTLVSNTKHDIDAFCDDLLKRYSIVASPEIGAKSRSMRMSDLDTKTRLDITRIKELVDRFEYSSFEGVMGRIERNKDKVSAVIPFGALYAYKDNEKEELAIKLIDKYIYGKRGMSMFEDNGSGILRITCTYADMLYDTGNGVVFGNCSMTGGVFAIIRGCVVYADADSGRVVHYYEDVPRVSDFYSYGKYIMDILSGLI